MHIYYNRCNVCLSKNGNFIETDALKLHQKLETKMRWGCLYVSMHGILLFVMYHMLEHHLFLRQYSLIFCYRTLKPFGVNILLQDFETFWSHSVKRKVF